MIVRELLISHYFSTFFQIFSLSFNAKKWRILTYKNWQLIATIRWFKILNDCLRLIIWWIVARVLHIIAIQCLHCFSNHASWKVIVAWRSEISVHTDNFHSKLPMEVKIVLGFTYVTYCKNSIFFKRHKRFKNKTKTSKQSNLVILTHKKYFLL